METLSLTGRVGMVGGFVFFSVLSYFFPPPDARVHKEYDWSDEQDSVIEGHEAADEEKSIERTSVPMEGKSDSLK